jgi:cobalt-zinc-cadmium efflux system membrane fusion protein
VKRCFRFLLVGSLIAIAACGGHANQEANQGANRGANQPAPVPPSEPGIIVIPADSPKLEQIRVEPVQMAEVPVGEVSAPGKVEANTNHISRVALPVAGRITQVMVKLGDSVKSGQPLLAIQSPDAEAAAATYAQGVAGVVQANATLSQAKSALIKAQADYDRAVDLYEHQATPQKEVLNARNALEQAQAAVDAANAGIEVAKAAREQARQRIRLLGLKEGEANRQVTVRSPLAGKVLELSVVAGEYRNDTAAPLLTIADLHTVFVTSDIPENAVRLIKPGEPVDITLDAYPTETFRGRVARLSDTLDPKTRTIKAMIELDNSHGRLRPEMFARIRLSEAVRNMPVLPVGAVIQCDGRNVVYVELSKGRFEERQVEIGKRIGDVVAVLSGVNQGERVVVDGVMLLKS